MNLEQKRYLVNGIENNANDTTDFLNEKFESLFKQDNLKKIIKVFKLSQMEAIKLLAFESETIDQFCINLANLQQDIYKKDGAIFWITDKLLEIEPKPYWVIWYKISEFKNWKTNYKSASFKAKKEVIRSLFALPKQVSQSNLVNSQLLNRWDDDVQNLCRLAFKNRRNPEKWDDEDERFRQDFHIKYENYLNYNEKNQNPERNRIAWETYGMCVYKADAGFWMVFDDLQNKQLKDEFIIRHKVYCLDSLEILKNNLDNKSMADLYKNAILIIQSNIEKLDNLLLNVA